jgi:hypothetical protein
MAGHCMPIALHWHCAPDLRLPEIKKLNSEVIVRVIIKIERVNDAQLCLFLSNSDLAHILELAFFFLTLT